LKLTPTITLAAREARNCFHLERRGWMKARAWIGTAAIGLLISACGEEPDGLSPDEAVGLLPPPAAPGPRINDDSYPDVYFDNPGVNPFVDSEDDALSTFALDVDTGSYTVARRFVSDGHRPHQDAVRVEEFVNYFDQGYPLPEAGTFGIHVDGGPTPYVQNDRNRVVRIGVQAMDVLETERKPAALTFVVDTSGSMEWGDRLGLVRESLTLLVGGLRPGDTVAIVEYGAEARVVLEPTPVEERAAIRRGIAQLRASGATNAAAGLRLGYRVAASSFTEGGTNRVVLASDGVANVGVTGANGILASIREEADLGVQLVTVGFGMGNYNDVLMEQLADNGDGFYSYVDTIEEAERLFVEELTGTLQTVALDARIQVAFEPSVVSSWRLIGFENRALEDEAFRDDSTDAGEIGAGHTVTALYEVKLTPEAAGASEATLGTSFLRWVDPEDGEARELVRTISTADLAPTFEQASPRFQLAVLVAEYAEVLRESFWAQQTGTTIEELADDVTMLRESLPSDEEVQEFVGMVRATPER
jgi:Ca-activated chloride channel family protein